MGRLVEAPGLGRTLFAEAKEGTACAGCGSRLAEREYPGLMIAAGQNLKRLLAATGRAPARSVWKHRGPMEVMNVTRKSQPVTVAIVLVDVT